MIDINDPFILRAYAPVIYWSPVLTFFTEPENASIISMVLLSSRRCAFYWSCLSFTLYWITILLILEEMGEKVLCMTHQPFILFHNFYFIQCSFVSFNANLKGSELLVAIVHVSIICLVWKHLSSSFFITVSWCDTVPISTNIQCSPATQHGSHFVCIQHGRLPWPALCGILWMAGLFVFLFFVCVNKPLFILKQLIC